MKNRMMGLILLLFMAALLVTGCERKAAEKEEAEEAAAQRLVIQKMTRTEQEEREIEKMREELPKTAFIETEVILQKPELPTGCESVALTMALKSLGYQLEKTTIAEEYMIYNKENFAAGYVGDPSSYSGVGIYPPGLTETANKFLRQRYRQQTAYDISKLDFEELFPYLAAGNPVLIWITIDMQEPYFSNAVAEYAGDEYPWYWNEHCVMLGGYNLPDSSVTLYDPLKGKEEVSLEKVKDIYTKAGKFAVTIY